MLKLVTETLEFGYEATEKVSSEIATNADKTIDYTIQKVEEIKDYTEKKVDEIIRHPKREVEEIKDYTIEKTEEIKDFFVARVDEINDSFEEELKKIKNYPKEKLNEIKQFPIKKTKEIKDFFDQKAKEIKDYPKKKADEVKDFFVKKAKDIVFHPEKNINVEEIEDFIEEKTKEIIAYPGEKIKEIEDFVEGKAKELTKYPGEKVKEIEDFIEEKAKEIEKIKDYTLKNVTEAFQTINQIPSDLIHGIITGCKKSVNNAQNKIGQFLAKFPNYLESKLHKDETVVPAKWDGKYLNCNCGDKGCIAEETNKPVGVKPSGCTAKELPKIFYINGINTKPDQNCTSASKLAKAICANVVPLYNRTEGIGGDLKECLENIKKTGQSPPTSAMVEMLIEKKAGEKVTIYAHSQGGLITQDALASYKRELTEPKPTGKGLSIEDAEKEMSNITVVSMGSAEEGWPKGPNYEQYTNEYDPVPKVIKEAQSTFPEETKTDNAEIDPKKQHKISNPNWDAVGAFSEKNSHSIDNTYIEGEGGLKEVKNKNGELCKCK